MAIQSVRPSALPDVSRPFAGEHGVTREADLERNLVDGHVPADLQQSVAPLQQAYQHGTRSALIVGSVIGAATAVGLGVAASVLSLGAVPLVAGAGALVGAAVKWVHHRRHDRGTVTIENEGQSRTTGFYVDPSRHERSAEDWRTILTAEGKVGDRIEMAPPPQLPVATPGPFDGHRDTLMTLAREHRLVGDLGQKSRYGHDVLSPVDAPTARRLLAAGQELYLLTGDAPVDTRHRYESQAASPDGRVKRNEVHEAVERHYQYGLSRIESPDQLQAVEQGQGLPAGLNGVYKNADQVSQVVQTTNQFGLARVDGKFTTRDKDAADTATDPSLSPGRPVDQPKIPLSHEDVNAGVAFGVVGAIIGVGVAALTGLSGGVALIPAFLLGSVGYKHFDKFMRSAQGLPPEG